MLVLQAANLWTEGHACYSTVYPLSVNMLFAHTVGKLFVSQNTLSVNSISTCVCENTELSDSLSYSEYKDEKKFCFTS